MRVHRSLASCLCVAIAFSFLAVLAPSTAGAQTRVNDKDVRAMMRNLHQDAKAFRPEFDSAVKKSTIRKTSQAKVAQQLARDFENQTGAMVRNFKKNSGSSPELRAAESTAEELDAVISNHVELGERVMDRWRKIRTELHQVMAVYNYPERFGVGRYEGATPE